MIPESLRDALFESLNITQPVKETLTEEVLVEHFTDPVLIERDASDAVRFTVHPEDESRLRRAFGYATDQVEGFSSVAGFLIDHETDEEVVLRIKRPFLVDKLIGPMS